MKKIIKDLKIYLDELERLSRKLPKEKRASLVNILRVILILLVSLKQSSNLGKIKMIWR